MTTHTPAPWRIHESRTQENEIRITTILGKSLIAKIYPKPNDDCQTANARLIAVAPDLLFYLKDLIEQVKQFPEISGGINMRYAEEAIKKAGGK